MFGQPSLGGDIITRPGPDAICGQAISMNDSRWLVRISAWQAGLKGPKAPTSNLRERIATKIAAENRKRKPLVQEVASFIYTISVARFGISFAAIRSKEICC